MRERYNWSGGKHPKACTCVDCQTRRALAAQPRGKKKRKPKSMRGKPKLNTGDAVSEAQRLLDGVPPSDQDNRPDAGRNPADPGGGGAGKSRGAADKPPGTRKSRLEQSQADAVAEAMRILNLGRDDSDNTQDSPKA